jgi:Rrf2 family protein
MLHILIHLARAETPLTSEQVAAMLGTNAVVVRRTMGGLREAGLVTSGKGRGGGWRIASDLADVSLLDVHKAVGGPHLFAIGNDSDNPECLVERVVNAALEQALAQAENILLERLAAVSLADLANQFEKLHPNAKGAPKAAARARAKSGRRATNRH